MRIDPGKVERIIYVPVAAAFGYIYIVLEPNLVQWGVIDATHVRNAIAATIPSIDPRLTAVIVLALVASITVFILRRIKSEKK